MTTLPKGWATPPHLSTAEGRLRRVGVEIEFAAVSCADVADLVASLYGGEVESESEFRYHVRNTQHGDFTIELDSQYAHADDADGDDLADRFSRWIAHFVGTVSEPFVPLEIVGPPVGIDALPELGGIIDGLRDLRAKDTRANPIFGFGMQLNPEVPARDAHSIRTHLQAYVLLEQWLRDEIDIDTTRRILPFADPFPEAYGDLILDPDYAPDLAGLIDDYLSHNATRNRGLDMLPMFRDLDSERVTSAMDASLVKPRPTFHYRLPDCRLSDPEWGIVTEWNRWIAVERLAADSDSLARLARQRAGHRETSAVSRLGDAISEWLAG